MDTKHWAETRQGWQSVAEAGIALLCCAAKESFENWDVGTENTTYTQGMAGRISKREKIRKRGKVRVRGKE